MDPKKNDVKIYGPGTSGQQMVAQQVHQFLTKADIAFDIEQKTNVSTFIKEGVESVPAIQINDGPITALKKNGAFNQSLREIISKILKEHNFGRLPQIVIPTDFSDTSVNAIYYGQRLATQLGGIIKLVHTYSPVGNEMGDSGMVQIEHNQLRATQLENVERKLDVDWGGDILKAPLVGHELRQGMPAPQILASIKENSAEMVIMGTAGDTGKIKKWFGSVSLTVMNNSSAPVLLVPPKAQYKSINRIVYAFDQYTLDKDCISQLLGFASKLSSEIHFVHVHEDGASDNPGYYLDEIVKAENPDIGYKIAQIAAENPSEALDQYAIVEQADLIAFGTTKKSVFQKLIAQSITREMAIHSRFPLLILKNSQ